MTLAAPSWQPWRKMCETWVLVSSVAAGGSVDQGKPQSFCVYFMCCGVSRRRVQHPCRPVRRLIQGVSGRDRCLAGVAPSRALPPSPFALLREETRVELV
jgi:hypothetical protein